MLATVPAQTPLEPYTARPLKAQCVNGHPMLSENVLWQRLRGKYHRRGLYPVCRLCRLLSQRQYAARRRLGHREGVLAVGG